MKTPSGIIWSWFHAKADWHYPGKDRVWTYPHKVYLHSSLFHNHYGAR